MNLQNFSIDAPPGSGLWNWLADVLNLAPGVNARPAWLRARTLLLQNATPTQVDPAGPNRGNPDYKFVCTHIAPFLETLPGDVAQISHLAYFQIVGGQSFNVFDRPQPFSAYGVGTGSALTLPVWLPCGFNGIKLPVPYVFAPGEDIVMTFTCDAGFPAVNHIAEVVLGGVYVSRHMKIGQPNQSLDLRIRMGKTLRKFLEFATQKAVAKG